MSDNKIKMHAIIMDFSGTLVSMRPPVLLVKRSLLYKLKRDFQIIVITGALSSETNNIVNKLNLANLLDALITKDDSVYRKPNKKLYLQAKKLYKFEKCVYVGDSISDAMFAENAGVPFCYIGKRKVGIIHSENINTLLRYIIKQFPDNIN